MLGSARDSLVRALTRSLLQFDQSAGTKGVTEWLLHKDNAVGEAGVEACVTCVVLLACSGDPCPPERNAGAQRAKRAKLTCSEDLLRPDEQWAPGVEFSGPGPPCIWQFRGPGSMISHVPGLPKVLGMS